MRLPDDLHRILNRALDSIAAMSGAFGVTHLATSQFQRGTNHAREKRRVAEQGGRR